MEHAPGVGEEYFLDHSSAHITKFKGGGGSYVHSETRSRNVFSNMSFSSLRIHFLYSENAHLGDVPANNFDFIRTFNTQKGLGRPGIHENKGA